MKKAILFIAFAATLGGSALQAQDTLEMWDVRDLPNCYIPSEWPRFPDDFAYNDYLKRYTVYLSTFRQNRQQQAEWGYRLLTDDTLEIYGIAGLLYPGNTMNNWLGIEPASDSSSLHSDTWLMLFAAEPDSLRQLVDTAYMYVDGWQPPQHYVKLGWGRYNEIIPDYPPLSLYERYFPLPVTVTDSFYVGFVVPRHWAPPSDITFPRVIVGELGVYPCPNNTMDFFERIHWKYHNTMYDYDEDFWAAGWNREYPSEHPLIFPIIVPPDTTVPPVDTVINPIDTTVNPIDTTDVGIRSNPDFVYRYTSVQPNPATDRVKVVSSFGLTRIEVYDTRGRLLHDLPASGLKATLDVSSWPRGTYLLRITTPVGQTTKKLLVQ